MHVLKLVLTYCVRVDLKRPYATDGTVANELSTYQVTIKEDGVYPSGDEEHETSQSPTSQLEVDLRSIVCASFTMKCACVFCSKLYREALLNRVK